MKRYFLIVAGILFTFSSQAQDIFQNHKFRIGLSVTPFYSYRNIKAPDSFQSVVDEVNSIDKAKIGYSTSLNLLFAIQKRITVETGVWFMDRGYKNRVSITTVNSPSPSIGTAKYRYHYNYVGIPLKVNLYLVNRKVRLFVSGGINLSMLVASFQNVNLQYDDGRSVKERVKGNLDNTYLILSAVAGVGLDIQLVKRLSLRFEPMFSYGFYNSQDSNIHYLPYEIGGTIGLHLGFK
jgi:hypothetical protein